MVSSFLVIVPFLPALLKNSLGKIFFNLLKTGFLFETQFNIFFADELNITVLFLSFIARIPSSEFSIRVT